MFDLVIKVKEGQINGIACYNACYDCRDNSIKDLKIYGV